MEVPFHKPILPEDLNDIFPKSVKNGSLTTPGPDPEKVSTNYRKTTPGPHRFGSIFGSKSL